MRQKRDYKRISDEQALDIIRGYHKRGETQLALAAKYGVSGPYVCRLCHGETRPELYRQVARENGENGASCPG